MVDIWPDGLTLKFIFTHWGFSPQTFTFTVNTRYCIHIRMESMFYQGSTSFISFHFAHLLLHVACSSDKHINILSPNCVTLNTRLHCPPLFSPRLNYSLLKCHTEGVSQYHCRSGFFGNKSSELCRTTKPNPESPAAERFCMLRADPSRE